MCRSDSRRYQQLQLCQPSLPLCLSLIFPLSLTGSSLFTGRLPGDHRLRTREQATPAALYMHSVLLTSDAVRPGSRSELHLRVYRPSSGTSSRMPRLHCLLPTASGQAESRRCRRLRLVARRHTQRRTHARTHLEVKVVARSKS